MNSSVMSVVRAKQVFFVLCLTCVATSRSRAQAGIEFIDLYRDLAYQQTGDGSTLGDQSAFFSARLYSTNASEYDSVTMTYPGSGSPLALIENPVPGTTYFYQTGFTTKAVIDADFPEGSYDFEAVGPGGTDQASFPYAFTDASYPQSLPYLTGTDFSDLQGLSPGLNFTFHISPFDAGSEADDSFLFLTVFDYDLASLVFNAGFLSPTTTEVLLPAGTLASGHSFAYEVVFSNRRYFDSTGTAFPSQAGFDIRTQGSFFTQAAPVPEPANWLMLGQVLVVGAWLTRSRYSKSTSTRAA